jgi:hypothetical protein
VGQDIQSSGFSREDLDKFNIRLKEETDLLRSWFDSNSFCTDYPMIGIELEGWLIDENSLPNPRAPKFLEQLSNSQIVPEISTFNFEINSNPYRFSDDVFSSLANELSDIWTECESSAEKLNSKAILMGTLATLRPEMLSLDYISSNKRFLVMNNQVMNFRKGEPLKIHLEGKDEVKLEVDSVITECAATSLQIHLGVNQENAKRYYNASLISSAFTVAMSANSPYFFGKELWDESRIAAFEQSVEMKSFKGRNGDIITRVTMGDGYIQDSLFELFDENQKLYPVLLPELDQNSSHENLDHLKLHNGTIWRWTRPIIGESPGGKKHLRIEQRTPSSGPTIVDSIANSVFFVGLCDYLAQLEVAPEELLSFQDNRDNFYLASKQSLYCRVTWLDGKKHDMIKLIKHELLPGIKESLMKRNISKKDIEYYIDYIIQGRLDSGINGARWQKAWIHCHGKKFQQLMEVYAENQKSGKPVHEWSL